MSIYSFCMPYVQGIKDWFVQNMGFKPTNSQVVSFAVYTLNDYYQDIGNDVKFSRKMFNLELANLSMTKEAKDKLYNLIRLHSFSITDNPTTVLSIIIYNRYISLPQEIIRKGKFTYFPSKKDIPNSMNYISGMFKEKRR